MKFFIDSCDIDAIEYWFDLGVGEGITTNPLIIMKQGVEDIDNHMRKIVDIADGLPVSIQITETELSKAQEQARHFASFGKNVVIKVPVVNSKGESLLPIIRTLNSEGFKVNATACLMTTQAILAAKAGARYVSLFFGRISDHGGDPVHQIDIVRKWILQANVNCEIIVGSIRTVYAINKSILAQPHICTVTPTVLDKCSYHAMSKQTARDFELAVAKEMA